MMAERKFYGQPAFIASIGLLSVLLISGGMVVKLVRSVEKGSLIIKGNRFAKTASTIHFEETLFDAASENAPVPDAEKVSPLFSSELRVIAIGSAYPIPYDAKVCPYTEIVQPSMDQFDRDSDGMTDDWETKFGLDKYNNKDATMDLDGDGFLNREEFISGTDPGDRSDHPSYATKLRFVGRKEVPFSLVFQGVTELSNGDTVFQLNTPADGLSHFASLGEVVEGVVLERFTPAENGVPAQLVVSREGIEIKLIRGQISADPESEAELINILDRSAIIVTMGQLLSLGTSEYTVLNVLSDKVILQEMSTGNVFDIYGLTDEDAE